MEKEVLNRLDDSKYSIAWTLKYIERMIERLGEPVDGGDEIDTVLDDEAFIATLGSRACIATVGAQQATVVRERGRCRCS